MSKNRIRVKFGHYERRKLAAHHERWEQLARTKGALGDRARADIRIRRFARSSRIVRFFARLAWRFSDRRTYRMIRWDRVDAALSGAAAE